MFLHKAIATFFGIGYIGKGSGTVAALALCLIYYGFIFFDFFNNGLALIATVLIFIIGVYSSTKAEKIWEHDSKYIVIDEVLGMMVSVLFVPLSWKTLLIAFVLFRLFDIYKPFGIRKAELLPSGVGVMADDLLAGTYTNLAMQVFCIFVGLN